jgi:hypothetical protein
MMRSPVFLLAVALTGVVIAGVFVFEVALGGGEDKVSRLISEDRTHLSLCVDSAGGRQAANADVAFVEDSLEAALSVTEIVPSEYGMATTTAGCPSPLNLNGDQITIVDRSRPEAFLYDPGLVSPHRLFVYLVPPAAFLSAFGHSEYDFSTSEYLCSGSPTPILVPGVLRDGQPCVPMTASVYVPSNVSREYLTDVLLYTLGLREETGPLVDWQSCVAGSAAHFCEVYQVCIPPMRTSPEFCEEFWDRTDLVRP